MINKIFSKVLVIGIIFLFVGTFFTPILSKNINKTNEIVIINNNEEFVSGEFIVKFNPEINIEISKSPGGWKTTGISSIDTLNEKYQVKNIEKLFNTCEKPYLYNIYKISVLKDSDIGSIVKDYSIDPNVIYIEPNYILKTCLTPNDPDFNLQYYLHNTGQTGGIIDSDIDAPEAWDIETGDETIVIAIHDTGVDYDHPDLEDNIWINPGEDLNGNGIVDPSDFNDVDDDSNGFIDDIRGYDFVNTTKPVPPGEDGTIWDNDPIDFHGHGTHCSGIASAVTDNNVGIAGVCWNSEIMPVRVGYKSGGSGLIDIVGAAAGLEYAADNGAHIISMSWGGGSVTYLIWDAINYSYSKGAILIAAAGNYNTDWKHYPAAYDKVIGVGATDHNDSKAGFSNYGSWVDVSAPGVNIYSTLFNDTYASWPGTSMSTPQVAALAALILSKNSLLNQDEVRTIIRSTTDNVTYSEKYIGTGRINAYQAIQRDTTPIANLNSELDDKIVVNEICINGTACGDHFVSYSVFYGKGLYPEEWTLIDSSSTPVENGVLAIWNVPIPEDEVLYTIRLVVIDTFDQESKDEAVVIIPLAPEIPTIDGPTNGEIDIPYSFRFNTTDPEEEEVYYYIDWGDGFYEDWIGPFASGESKRVTHSWSTKGTYKIKAKAKNIYGAESDWGTLDVTIPREKELGIRISLLNFLKDYLNLFSIKQLLLQYLGL
jgi:subtilisin family serine protease